MTTRLLAESEYATWDDWLAGAAGANVHQTSTYRRALSLYGYTSEILVTEDAGHMRGGALLAVRRLGPMVGPLVRTSGGLALVADRETGELEELVGAVLQRCRQLRASTVEVSLRIPVLSGDSVNARGEDGERALRGHGFGPGGSMGTYLIDLSVDSDAQLLESFGENPRRQIEEAQRAGVVVDRTEQPEDFLGFQNTHRDMCRRHGFDQMPERFQTEVFLPLVRKGQGDLFVARYQDTPMHYIFVGSVRDPIRHEWAVAAAAEDEGQPPTQAMLHYSAMCHYRTQGKPHYDLGGAEGAIPDPADPNYATWRFKYEFRGTYTRFVGPWRRTLRPLDSAFLALLRRGRRLQRRLAWR